MILYNHELLQCERAKRHHKSDQLAQMVSWQYYLLLWEDGLAVGWNLARGWGFHCWEETVEGEPEFVMHSAAAANAMVEDGSVTNDPVFSIAGTQLNNRNATQDDIWLSLAKHVPAVSSPVGGMATLGFEDHDLNGQSYREGWGRQGSVYNQNWLHSDMKATAYFYVYPLYDEIG